MVEEVKVFDSRDREVTDEVDPWDSWDKVKEEKGFPAGLVTFLQTSTDAEGCGFPAPTVVQAFAWPILQAGQDLVGVAKTGSGKTLAFLLPGFIKLRKMKRTGEVDTAEGPALLAMTPTRELCYQIFSDAEKFGKPVGITACCAYGGAGKREQEQAFRREPDCIIATPGRLNDFLNCESVKLSQCRYAVLDEADRMLDMGFEPQIRQIMERVPADRQTAMFTATWPRECQKLADRYITEPKRVQIGSDGITTNKNITQHIEVCDDNNEKKLALKGLLKELPNGNCLIFCNTKKNCSTLSWELSREKSLDLEAVELHGDLNQGQRDSAMAKFKSGKARVLVATDVAARGLDIRNVTTVVNFDAPPTQEDYIHRIGRTGRAEDTGDAYTFLLSYGEEKKAHNISSTMEQANQEVPQSLKDLLRGKAQSTVQGRFSDQSWGGSSSYGNNKSWKDNSKSWGDDDDQWGGGGGWNKNKDWGDNSGYGKKDNGWGEDSWKRKAEDDGYTPRPSKAPKWGGY
mmetsp:Transcript_22250/g.40973  ORF Transcript_22250/g.40973 Transcript_22250/m.40973 type:complete len:515 (-) Transcript_22250:59-1603(-)